MSVPDTEEQRKWFKGSRETSGTAPKHCRRIAAPRTEPLNNGYVAAFSHSGPVPGWLLDEVASAGREILDPAQVARYDNKMDGEAEEEIALCQSLGSGPSSTVVEFGSGTGQFTTAVASKCTRVVAVDVYADMQDRLHTKLIDGGITNVEQVRAGFLRRRHKGIVIQDG